MKEGLSGWGMLGVGEFWIGVATRVVGVCRRTRGENGGFIAVEEVRRILVAEDRKARRKDVVEISEYLLPSPCPWRNPHFPVTTASGGYLLLELHYYVSV